MIRVGLIGCGFMGRMHATVYERLENARVAAFADRTPDKAQSFAAEFGGEAYATLADMLQGTELDAVDICLPTHLHAQATIEAARAGKHVLCEKPMALTLEEADRMAAACDEAGVRLMIGHCIRFWPEYALLKQIVDDRRYGNLLSASFVRYGEFPSWSSDNWLADESLSGGGVLDMHIHDTDFSQYLLGEPTEMRSFGTIDATGPSHVFTTMRYPGAVVHLEGGWNLPPGTPFKMAFRAIFERGAAIWDGGPMQLFEVGKEPSQPKFEAMKANGGGNISDLGGYYHEIKYFADRLASGLPFETVTPATSRQSLATVLEEIRQIRNS